MAKHAEQRKVEVDPRHITFGVEIECLIPARFVRDHGITVGRYYHGAPLPPPFIAGWTAQRDGSLLSESGFTPMEIVSPVLRSIAGLQEVLNVFRVLNDAGAKVNDSCGFHVHVGARMGGSMVFDNLDYLPTRFYPAKSQIVLISPLCEADPPVLSRLRARGYEVLVVSPDPIHFEQRGIPQTEIGKMAIGIARAERNLWTYQLKRLGIPVIDWEVDQPLDTAVRIGLRRSYHPIAKQI